MQRILASGRWCARRELSDGSRLTRSLLLYVLSRCCVAVVSFSSGRPFLVISIFALSKLFMCVAATGRFFTLMRMAWGGL